MRKVQLEAKKSPTSFMVGTRNAETFTIPTAGVIVPTEGTIDIRCYIGAHQKRQVAGSLQRVIDIGRASGGIGLLMYHQATTAFWVIESRNDANTVSASQLADSTTPDGVRLITFSFNALSLKAFVDGILRLTINEPNLPSGFSTFRIGRSSGNIDFLNTSFHEVRCSSIARSDSEIAAYGALQELPRDQNTTYHLTFNGSIYPVEQCWIPLGTFWSGDWRGPEDAVWAQTSGRDRMELLRKSTFSTSQVFISTTLYNLAEIVLLDAGLSAAEFWIDPELQAFPIPYAYFQPTPHREALRQIAEACLGQAYVARNGVVRIEGPSFLTGYRTSSQLTTTRDDFFSGKDNPVQWGSIANVVEVDTEPLRPSATPEEVFRSNDPESIDADQTKTITVFFNAPPVIEAVASLVGEPSGASIVSATYYSWGASIEVYSPAAGTFTLIVDGKPLRVANKERATAQDADSIADNGRIRYKVPGNHLVQTRAVAQKIADALLAAFKDPRRDLDLPWRGNPTLELADRITVPDFLDEHPTDYHVTRQQLQYDGGLKSRISGRRAG